MFGASAQPWLLLYLVAAPSIVPCVGFTGLDDAAWYAVKDVPLGTGGFEVLSLAPTRCSALRLWFTQPSSSLGVSVRDIVVNGPNNQTIPITRAVALSWRRSHRVEHVIDANRDTYWACDWTPGSVPWLEVHFAKTMTVESVWLRWGTQFASMYRIDASGPCQPTAAMRTCTRILGLRLPSSQTVRGSGAHNRDERHAKRICC